MNLARITLLVCLCRALVQAEPIFIGVLDRGNQETLFAVSPAPDVPARWLKLGDALNGYSLQEFRTAEETLVLAKGQETLRLKLRASRVSAAVTVVTPQHVDQRIAEEIAQRFNGDRAKYLSYLRERGKTPREYRLETEARLKNSGQPKP